jgi:hypothetical protein
VAAGLVTSTEPKGDAITVTRVGDPHQACPKKTSN